MENQISGVCMGVPKPSGLAYLHVYGLWDLLYKHWIRIVPFVIQKHLVRIGWSRENSSVANFCFTNGLLRICCGYAWHSRLTNKTVSVMQSPLNCLYRATIETLVKTNLSASRANCFEHSISGLLSLSIYYINVRRKCLQSAKKCWQKKGIRYSCSPATSAWWSLLLLSKGLACNAECSAASCRCEGEPNGWKTSWLVYQIGFHLTS